VATSLFLSLREDVSLVPGDNGDVVLQSAYSRVVVRPAVTEAWAALAAAGGREDQLAECALEAGGIAGLAGFYHQLQQLTRRGLVLRSVCVDGERLATLIPTSPAFRFPGREIAPESSYVLSRFAYSRAERGRVVLESPTAHARVVLHDGRAAALVHALAQPRPGRDLAGLVPGLAAAAGEQLLTLLVNAGMAGTAAADGELAEESDPALLTWEFHDLLFHVRSREGRHDYPFGPTYRVADRLPPPPAVKPFAAAETVALYRPDLAALERQDPPLVRVMEERRSLRAHGAEPMTDRQLGEFLYRVARIKECRALEVLTPHGPVRMDFTARPYPTGGALYEMEVYAVIRACANLAPGLYHYDPLQHRLGRVSGLTADVEQLLYGAALAMGMPPEQFQVLLVLAARFQRLAWKYEGLAYALLLKHVGILQQSMYLAAAAMGLAPCAIGTGNSEVFARALGSDYYAETSVGEFALGSLP
jgi:SagB-type dehydrogenase family enzyme